jgi:hypothetical protein
MIKVRSSVFKFILEMRDELNLIISSKCYL